MKSLHIYMNHILECLGRPLTHFITVPIIRSMESAHIRRSAAAASRVPVCLRRHAQRFEVDKPHSFMIGDKLLDVEAGNNYGLTTILVGNRLWKRIRSQEEKEGIPPVYDFTRRIS